MASIVRSLIVASALGGAGAMAHAESLKCNGAIANEGESRLSLLQKCGQPMLTDSFCEPVTYAVRPSYEPQIYPLPICQPVEEWVYDRGEGNLMATVRFRGGVVHSIKYTRQAR